MSDDRFVLFTAVVPCGHATHAFVEQLTGTLGVWDVVHHSARRAVAVHGRLPLRLVDDQEVDEISVLCPAGLAEAVFALAVTVLRIGEPGRGMLRRLTPARATAMVAASLLRPADGDSIGD